MSPGIDLRFLLGADPRTALQSRAGSGVDNLAEMDADDLRDVAREALGALIRTTGVERGEKDLGTFAIDGEGPRPLTLTWNVNNLDAELTIQGRDSKAFIPAAAVEALIRALTEKALPLARAYVANEQRNLDALLGAADKAPQAPPSPRATSRGGRS